MQGTSRIGSRRGALLAPLVVLVACGEPDELVVREGEQEAAFCDASCARGVQCGGGQSLDLCKTDCRAYVSGLENVRPDAVEIVAECVLDLPCSGFFDSDAFTPCWDRAEREVEPAESLRRFCQTWSTRWFECGSSYPIEQCESEWVLSSRRYLERILACADRPCEEIGECSLSVESGGAG